MPLTEFEADFPVDADLFHAQSGVNGYAGAVRKGDAREEAVIALMPQYLDQYVVETPPDPATMMISRQIDGDIRRPIISRPAAMGSGIGISHYLTIHLGDQPWVIF